MDTNQQQQSQTNTNPPVPPKPTIPPDQMAEVKTVLATSDSAAICPKCHLPVKSSDYFCANCGTELRPPPPSISLTKQMSLYIGSLILPPFGLIWGARYLRQDDSKSKMVGWICVVLTCISLVVTVVITIQTINTVNEQVEKQMSALQAF